MAANVGSFESHPLYYNFQSGPWRSTEEGTSSDPSDSLSTEISESDGELTDYNELPTAKGFDNLDNKVFSKAQ